jgi:hypothetical protein
VVVSKVNEKYVLKIVIFSLTEVMILKIFSPKNLAKIVFFSQTSASFCKKCDHFIVYFLEKRQFLPKI